jgi:glycosyltransferase involved in cell wall biosynthesis
MKTKKPSLRDLFAAHTGKVSDKWDIYISEYDRLFQPYRDEPVRLLEIGIQNGGSLEVWNKYFAKAKKIVGSDIDLACEQLKFDDPKIAVVVADANTDDAEKRILAESNVFDLIIDDGSHRSGDIVRSFARYFKHLADGGLYIAEDLHCSYWQDFEGGIFQPYSSIAFFKRLADTVNYEHWGVDKTRIELLDTFSREYHVSLDETTLANVHSVEFINSMCVIKKASPTYNVLGQRFIAGTQAVVDTAPLPLHGTLSAQRDQTTNAWSSGKNFPEDEVQSKAQEVEALTQTIGDLNRKLVNTNAVASALQQSKDEVISASANRVDKLIAQIAERERVFKMELSKFQQSHDTAIEKLVEQHHLQAQIYIQDLSKTRSEKEAQLLLQVKREKEFLEKIEDLQKLHENLMQAQAHQHTEQNNLVSKNLEEARRLLNEKNNQALTREIAHSEKREALQVLHAAQITGYLEAHAIEQKAFLEQLAMLHAEALKLREHADMQVKEFQLKNLALTDELDAIRNTSIWRWTAALRNIFNWQIQKNIPINLTTLQTTKKPLHMPSEKTSLTVITLKELLLLNDERFIYSAYQAVLHRASDPEGLRYYLTRLHTGVSKIEILAQLRNSKEGKSKSLKIEGLDNEITKFLRTKHSLLNKSLRFFGINHLKQNKQKKITKHHQKLINESNNLTRLVNNFDAQWYVEQYSVELGSNVEPFKHYISIGRLEGLLPAFDADWYLSQYLDVAKSGMDPREHYRKHGKLEGRHPAFDRDWYLRTYPDVWESGLEPIDHYLNRGKTEGRYPAYSPYGNDRNNYLKWVREFDSLTDTTRNEIRTRISKFQLRPLISVVMPVYNANPQWLEEAIKSVQEQIYPNWELCIADDASTNLDVRKLLKKYSEQDKRIKVIFREKNGHISAASNSALALAKGEWIALLDHDDLITEHALFWVVDAINKKPQVCLIYSDEDKIDEVGVRSGPYFKCDWNQDLFYSHNLITHLGVYRATLIQSIEGFRLGLEGAQDYDLALRCIECIESNQIHHIPRVLYHWRVHAESTAQSSDAKPYAMIAGERALNEHLARKGLNAKAELKVYGYRVHYDLPNNLPLVSLIIPTRNGLAFLSQCVNSILKKTTYTNFEILIIDNGSDDINTLNYLKNIVKNSLVRVIRDDSPFNYSALNNSAVKFARGEVIGLINNDIEVINPEWLTEMVSHVMRPEIGAVGARLWYSNDTLQHGGVILGLGGVVAHSHRKLPKDNPGYCGRASLIQSFSAVTAACLLIRKSTYNSVGGLNETDLQVAYNDVDFCLRVREAGYRNIWTPYAELYHHESATRGTEDTPEKQARFEKEKIYMQTRWGELLQNDPAYSPNLTFSDEDFSLAWPPRTENLT